MYKIGAKGAPGSATVYMTAEEVLAAFAAKNKSMYSGLQWCKIKKVAQKLLAQ